MNIDVSQKIRIAGQGASESTNWKLCWQSHDSYYDCIDKQVTSGEVNKFKCMNSLYMYEMYCPSNFIKFRKENYKRNLKDRENWTEDQLALINYKKNNVKLDKPLPNNANFENSHYNSLVFKHF